MTRYEQNFNFLASLLSRGDWFETCFVGNPEDRFSRVVASYISVACSAALGQILQLQQIIIFKQVAQRATIAHLRASIMFGDTIIDDAERQVTLNLKQGQELIKNIRYYASPGNLQVLKRSE